MKTATSDAIGASSEQPRRAVAETGIAKAPIDMVSEGPTSAIVIVIAETDAMAEARVSIKREFA
eukprot:4301513-Pleurochrysis_carterae.AAC.1